MTNAAFAGYGVGFWLLSLATSLACLVELRLPGWVRRATSWVLLLLLPLGAFVAVDFINSTRILSFTFEKMLANYLCYLMVFAVIYAIFRRVWVTALAGGLLFLIFGIANYFVAVSYTHLDVYKRQVYSGGKSEVALKEAVVDRYPRDSFQCATKLPFWDMKEPSEMETVFQTSLDRAGLEYYDFYLLHGLNAEVVKKVDAFGGWDFVKGLKEQGRVKHIGFSFHDTAEVLESILQAHPEMEFVQLQINYVDWESECVQSRKCYEVARKYNCLLYTSR